jgi:1-acyl-sn-glycerol-3-phosphate acyltransferase
MNDFDTQAMIHFDSHARPWAAWVLRQMGWSLECQGFVSPWGVAIVYPHTSNWDFVVMILAKWAIGVPAHFIAKDSLFKWPLLGPWLRHVGGLAVDRRSPHGVVAQIVQTFQAHQARGQALWLGITPEGTRSYVHHWKSGFYTIALEAQLPLGLVVLDYAQKRISFTNFLQLSGELESDVARVRHVYEGVRGKYPHLASPITWRLKDKADQG